MAIPLVRLNRFDEAALCYARAIELKPNYADAHMGKGLMALLRGKLVEAWPDYEWRRKLAGRSVPWPNLCWTGDSLSGRTILLHSEQGHGDSLQFIRYAKLVKQQGGTVIVQCQKSLTRLFATCAGVDQVLAKGEPTPPFDVHASLMSLPAIFRTSLETIPADIPYLSAEPQLAAQWRDELAEEPALKVGIAWQGSPTSVADRARSFPLEHFAGVAAMRGVQLYILQNGTGREQLPEFAGRFPVVDAGPRLGDFYSTAALVCNLDLVITCDSAPAHLAGALGMPVWVALPFQPDWRWMLERTDSPWYPTLRLFRQEQPGDWHGVFRRIEQALADRARVNACGP